jgi:integrase
MATIKLTEKTVAKLLAPTKSGRQELYWDEDQAGFGVLCSGVSDTKTFIAQTRIAASRLKRRVTIGRCDRLKLTEARDKAKAVLATMDLGNDPKAKGNTLSVKAALEVYLNGSSLRANSVDGYRRAFANYLGDWADKPLGEIDRDMVEKKHAEIGDQNGQATANATFRAFRAVYNMAAERDDSLPPNPVKILKRRWFKIERRTRMVKFDQLEDFYSALKNLESKVVADYIRLLLFTGLRRTEAASLRWSDVDFAAKTFSIPGDRTKSGAALTLPMTDLVFDLLVTRRASGKETFIFPANSKSKHIEEPKDAFDEIAKATGIRVSAHDLRRTFITIAESLDISSLAIKALVNHAPPRDVTSGYVILKTERLRDPAQRIADKLRQLCNIARVEAANVAALR